MLGDAQERWLLDGLAASDVRWNVLVNNVMMGRLDHDGPSGDILWHDAWDGFPAARTRLTDHFVNAGVRNPVVIIGDWHSTSSTTSSGTSTGPTRRWWPPSS